MSLNLKSYYTEKDFNHAIKSHNNPNIEVNSLTSYCDDFSIKMVWDSKNGLDKLNNEVCYYLDYNGECKLLFKEIKGIGIDPIIVKNCDLRLETMVDILLDFDSCHHTLGYKNEDILTTKFN